VSGCRMDHKIGNFPLSVLLPIGSKSRAWRRPQCRYIASEIKRLISFASETKMSLSIPIPPKPKSVSSPRARPRLQEYHAGIPDKRLLPQRLPWQGAEPVWVESGNCRPAPLMTTQSCGFGSRVRTNGTGHQLAICRDRTSSLRYGSLMINSGDRVDAGVYP
jgi:hypothetical protein